MVRVAVMRVVVQAHSMVAAMLVVVLVVPILQEALIITMAVFIMGIMAALEGPDMVMEA